MTTYDKKLIQKDHLFVHDLINHLTGISLQCSLLRECAPGSIEGKQLIEKLYERCRIAQQYIVRNRKNIP